jgi:hypothetical protein
MAADFSSARPTEPNKIGEYLHDQSRIPRGPRADVVSLAKRYWGMTFGILLGLGLTAAGFEIRDSWKEHRDWVIPVIAMGMLIAGVLMGHLVQRGRWAAVTPAIVFAFVAVLFTVFDVIRAQMIDPGPDAGRKALGVLATIFFVATAVWAIIATLVVELRNPTRPPEPEL